MTLATCEAACRSRSLEPEVVAATFVRWFRAGRINGLGASTLKALRDLDAGVHWALAGAQGEYAAGNGAAMRAAPLGLVLDPEAEDDRQTIRGLCRITHRNEEAYLGALAVAAAVRGLACSRWTPGNILTLVEPLLPDSATRDRIRLLAGMSASIAQVGRRFGSSGHVVESVPLALYAAQRVGEVPVREVLGEVVSVGGDADTIGSICGQVAGAAVGLNELPQELVARLPLSTAQIQQIDDFCDDL